MLPRCRTALSLMLALPGLWGTGASEAQAAGSTDTLYHVHGTVLDGVTGKPIMRALVTSNDQRLATLTDRDGHFTLDVSVPPLPAGQPTGSYQSLLSLQTRKPGYFQKGFPPPIDLGDEAAAGAVELKLMPGAALAGRVSAARSDTPEGVRVALLRRQVQEGLYTWQQAGAQVTDASGQFRFANLEAGEYTVATATWRDDDEGQPEPAPRPRANSPREQYPAVYDGDVPALAQATILHLHFGERASAELHLHPATFYPVTVPVASASPNLYVSALLAGGESYTGMFLRYNQQTHLLQGLLPAGSYSLRITGYERGTNDGGPATRMFASVPLVVTDAPVRTAAVVLAPGPNLEVHVQTQFTQASSRGGDFVVLNRHSGEQQQRPPLNFYLRPVEPGVNFSGQQQKPAGANSFLLEGLQPGRYAAVTQPFQGYVASITCGGVDLLRQPLIVQNGMPPIEVLLVDSSATVTGSITGLATPTTPFASGRRGEYSVVLLSTDGAGRMVQGFLQQQGKFAAYNVPPGTYRAFACQRAATAVAVPRARWAPHT